MSSGVWTSGGVHTTEGPDNIRCALSGKPVKSAPTLLSEWRQRLVRPHVSLSIKDLKLSLGRAGASVGT